MLLKVHLQPRASRNAVLGWQDDELRIALTAPPVDGAANAALIEFIADIAGIKRRQINLLRGDTSRHKQLQIECDEAAALDKINRLLAP